MIFYFFFFTIHPSFSTPSYVPHNNVVLYPLFVSLYWYIRRSNNKNTISVIIVVYVLRLVLSGWHGSRETGSYYLELRLASIVRQPAIQKLLEHRPPNRRQTRRLVLVVWCYSRRGEGRIVNLRFLPPSTSDEMTTNVSRQHVSSWVDSLERRSSSSSSGDS